MTQIWDPLAGEYVEDDEPAAPIVARKLPRAAIYGEVYELITTRPDLDGPHPYVGKAKNAYRRVNGPGASAHRSLRSIEKDEWKARVPPGHAGFRILEQIPATGDDAADEQRLRLREAYWIDRLETTYNDQRPKYEHGNARALRRPTSAPRATGPSKAEVARQRAQGRKRRRVLGFAVLFMMATALAAMLIVHMALPWPAAPWTVSPVLGLVAAVPAFQYIDGKIRRITRGRR
jgi:hypothetical protein